MSHKPLSFLWVILLTGHPPVLCPWLPRKQKGLPRRKSSVPAPPELVKCKIGVYGSRSESSSSFCCSMSAHAISSGAGRSIQGLDPPPETGVGFQELWLQHLQLTCKYQIWTQVTRSFCVVLPFEILRSGSLRLWKDRRGISHLTVAHNDGESRETFQPEPCGGCHLVSQVEQGSLRTCLGA